jgi:cellulose synthase/poly-beta-1,6-N-acetylglucosamine synthase-like glycosyltransferase
MTLDSIPWLTVGLTGLILLYAYPFLIYPLLLGPVVSIWGRRELASAPLEVPAPRVALIICALNEEGVIREKIKNSLALEYPEDRLRTVIVSDGSTDRTVEIARGFGPAVELVERTERRGKIANLNDVIPARDEEIVVLSDANVMYDSHAVGRLVERLRDPGIGCVSGKVVLVDTAEDLAESEGAYYSLEWKLQEAASRIHSLVGADGAMYALRRELFQRIPSDTLIEDLVIPLNVVRAGRRVVFEPSALAWEVGVSSVGEEFRRKVRIAAGAAQALVRGNGWPRGAPLRYWWVFASHKLLRWISPFIGLALLATAATRVEHPLSRAVLLAAAALLAAALLGMVVGRRWMPLNGAFYFVFSQVAIAWGFLKGLTGRQSVFWAKKNR